MMFQKQAAYYFFSCLSYFSGFFCFEKEEQHRVLRTVPSPFSMHVFQSDIQVCLSTPKYADAVAECLSSPVVSFLPRVPALIKALNTFFNLFLSNMGASRS